MGSVDKSRARTLAVAASLVDDLHAEWISHHASRVGGTSPIDALRSALILGLADASDSAWVEVPHAQRLRGILYEVREQMRLLVGLFDYLRQSISRSGQGGVVFVPRNESHLRMLLPVAKELREQCVTRWLVFKSEHRRTLLQTREEVVLAQPLVAALSREVRGTMTALRTDAESFFALPLVQQRIEGSAGTIASVLRRGFVENMIPAALTAAGIERTISAVQPDVVMVGNPNTMEGRIAVSVARRAGVPSATVQHGDISEGDPSWRGAATDRIFVWGNAAKQTLVSMGIDATRVEVVGHPEVGPDAGGALKSPATGGRAQTVLVALSGAGHMVGMTEHLAHVERLAAAAAATPELTWLFRLHPKDSADIYNAAFARVKARNVEVVLARKSMLDMRAQLRQCALLVTVTSTSAIDAMLQGVPVIALARTARDEAPAFVNADAVVQVGPAESLPDAVHELLRRGSPPDVARNVETFLDDHVGARDGLAAHRVAQRLCEMTAGTAR